MLAHERAVTCDQQHRQVGHRQRDDRQNDRVLGQEHRVHAGLDDHERKREERKPREREARRLARAAILSPLPAGELRERVGAGERALDRRAADREEHPQQREDKAGLAEGALGSEGRRSKISRLNLRIEEHLTGDDDQRDREHSAKGEAEYRRWRD